MKNTKKFYWLGKQEVGIDYPSHMVGSRTPSIFHFTKMEHLYTLLGMAETRPDEKVIESGSDTYSPREFMEEIADTRMWNFDRPLW
jgi:hypothetical protein